MNTFEKDKEYIANTYARFPLAVKEGHGAILVDESGKEYIDLGSGIAVNTFGAGDDEWVSAVSNQAKALSHISNLYYTQPQVQLAKLLCEKTGMKKVFFGNSGAEANECAIKVARKYGGSRSVVVSLEGSFHGRTLATLAMTGQDVFHTQFLPLPLGFKHTPPNDIAALESALDDTVCALMLEIVQGEGGVNPVDKAFAQRAQEICRERDILLMVDEVQTGMGRTGSLFAYMQYGLTPDVVTSAKGLGGGLPIGACLMGEKAQNVLGLSDHGSTFGGNPICAAGAVSIVERLDEKLLSDVQKKSGYIFETLKGKSGIKAISGMGLMIGIETDKPAREVVDACLKQGVVTLTAKNKVRLLPPLTISFGQLEKALKVLVDNCAV